MSADRQQLARVGQRLYPRAATATVCPCVHHDSPGLKEQVQSFQTVAHSCARSFATERKLTHSFSIGCALFFGEAGPLPLSSRNCNSFRMITIQTASSATPLESYSCKLPGVGVQGVPTKLTCGTNELSLAPLLRFKRRSTLDPDPWRPRQTQRRVRPNEGGNTLLTCQMALAKDCEKCGPNTCENACGI